MIDHPGHKARVIQIFVVEDLKMDRTVLQTELKQAVADDIPADIGAVQLIQRNERVDNRDSVRVLKLQLLRHFEERNLLMTDSLGKRNLQFVQHRFEGGLVADPILQNNRMVNGPPRLLCFLHNRHADKNSGITRISVQQDLNSRQQNHIGGQRHALAHLNDPLRRSAGQSSGNGQDAWSRVAWSLTVRQQGKRTIFT